MAELIHYSAKPLTKIDDRLDSEQVQYGPKPDGIWFSNHNKDGWRTWCKKEDFRGERFAYKTVIKFKPDARVLSISNKRGLDTFFDKYKSAEMYSEDGGTSFNWWIDWKKVSKDYDAIYFPKYFDSCRKRHPWYSTWDVASGCIWNTKAIQSAVCTKVPVNDNEPMKEAA